MHHFIPEMLGEYQFNDRTIKTVHVEFSWYYAT